MPFQLTTPKYGCQLPQETSDVNYIFEVAKDCENLGYDSVWAYDHLMPYWLRSRSSLDQWSVLSAVAARTSKVKIGSLVTNVSFRNPALLAKMTSTVDNISDGRLILGLGIGDRMSVPELRSYGYGFPTMNERVALLRETIMILKAMWTGKEVSFRGRMVNVSNAVCLPKPKQKLGPPIWIGGKHRRLIDVVAELADGWNHWGLTRPKVLRLEKYLRSKCAQFHRDPSGITESWAGTISSPSSNSVDLTETIMKELQSQIGRETNYFIASFPAGTGRKTYETFAEAVRAAA
jgi:alkanesulfonate monooxygenase SsuD/methylene tetrahydromethanopterin reductase-like flavin-dependent oxidoreductase (luciferase family)